MAWHFYADGSGHVDYSPPTGEGEHTHFVLAGILVTPQQRATLEAECDGIVAKWLPDIEPRAVELHTNSIMQGDGEWAAIAYSDRPKVFDEVRDVLLKVQPKLFGQVVHKQNYWDHFTYIIPEPPAIMAMRYVLGRVSKELGANETCTLTIDDDSQEMKEAQLSLESTIRTHGDRIPGSEKPVQPTNIANLHRIHHLDSNNSRCLQLADYVAHFTWQGAEYLKARRIRELDGLWRALSYAREPWLTYPTKEVEATLTK